MATFGNENRKKEFLLPKKKYFLMATFGNENRKKEFLLVKKKEFLMLKFGQIKNNNVSAPEKIYKELHTQQPKLLTMWN